MFYICCLGYQLFEILRTYLLNSSISIRMQSARFVWVSLPESTIQSVCVEHLLWIKATGVRGSSCWQQYPRNNLFLFSPSWILNGVSSILAVWARALSPLHIPLRGGPVPLFGSELPLLGMFLDYMHMGSCLLICETQSPTRDLWEEGSICFKALFLWEESFCVDLEECSCPLSPKFFTSQLLIKGEIRFWGNWVSVL